MAASQKIAFEEMPDSPALSPGFGSATLGDLQQIQKNSTENLRGNLRYHNERSKDSNRQDSYCHDNEPEMKNIRKGCPCPGFTPNQSSECCISNAEAKSKHLQIEQSDSTENVSLLHCFHSLQEKSLYSCHSEEVENQLSCIHDIVRQSGLKQAGMHQQQIDLETIDNVIGDELDGKLSSGHHFCNDAPESTAPEKHIPSLLKNPVKLPDAATERISCSNRSSPRRSQSEHSLTESNNETKSKLQLVSCSKSVEQLISSPIESTVSLFSSSSSLSSSSSSSLHSISSLVEGRTLGSEQKSYRADSSNASKPSISQTGGNMSNKAEATEMDAPQDSHVTLLRALLTEKDEDLNQLNKEMKKLQLINKQLLEEQCLIMSTNKRLRDKTNKVLENKVKGGTSDSHPTAPVLLQQRNDLIRYLKDLQDANDSAVNELMKADEEISQLRGEMAKLRSTYAEKLQDAKKQNDHLQDKINRLQYHPSQLTLEEDAFGLLDEIHQLRNESRKLREVNHKLVEENRQLKEVLWDFKQQREWLSKKNFKKKKVEITKKGRGTMSARKLDLPKKEEETAQQKTSSLPFQSQEASLSSQFKFEYFNIEERSSSNKSSERVTFNPSLQTWDDEDKSRATSNDSPISVDSDNTEVLLASCNDLNFDQGSNSKKQCLKGNLCDLDGDSDDDTSSISQINGQYQFPQCSNSIPCNSTASSPEIWVSCLNRKNTGRSIDKGVLPRRPFAPRSIADLKIGHLVKFSRPAGKISKGLVKYLGHLPGRQEAYLGVELEGDEVGRHNGTFEGVCYFVCKLNKGVFVNFNKVIMAWE
ncbi:centrosome-associated protein 350-like isoform X2 [Stegostoma tigrinum]|uniref:centrosome-associated protein 350-like isoform X2 n=1 Tax=Stegostoma tigrinum TaxID=3053191 RepID=UPI00202B96C8|nr:centrosome-associated protein 350-like isoform X2 [Stegostoma tigrinum]